MKCITDHDLFRNQKSLTETLWSVLRTLSKWEESGRGQQDKQQPDLEMELGAYSPSDSKHFFRDFRLERTYPYRVENDLDETFEGYSSWMQSKPMVDEFHGWSANGERQRPPPDGAKRRLLGRAPLLQDFHGFDRRRKRSFPRVQAVTSLVITRRFYRNFDPRLLGNLIKNCFPRLRHFRHEWWYSVDLELQHRYEDRKCSIAVGRKPELNVERILTRETGYACFLLPHLPPTLQELHLCQESSFTLHQDVDVKLSRATKRLRKASRNLVHLSASNIVSGAYFLGVGDSAFDFGVDEGWPNLQTLSLSTSYIVPKKRGWDNLLVGAARAALLMPELKVMELWGVYDGEGAIFCYNAHGKEAPLMRLTSTDTQRCRIRGEPPSFELWKKVARRHGRGELVIETRFLEMARLSTGHNFASETFLKHRILSRLSLHQRLWESRHPSNC